MLQEKLEESYPGLFFLRKHGRRNAKGILEMYEVRQQEAVVVYWLVFQVAGREDVVVLNNSCVDNFEAYKILNHLGFWAGAE